jgi:tripartite ATP-independent transporter DctP family solute receptor
MNPSPVTRRRFLGATLATGGALATGIRPTHAQTKAWRLGHQFPLDHPMNIGFQKVADVLKEKSNGRLRIDIFPTSQLGTGREMDQQVSDGTLEFTSDGPGILSAWVKTLSIFEAPFISRDWNHLVLMMNSDWGKAQFAELAKSKDMLLIGNPWYYGTRQTTTKERAVKTVADMKGLKIRVPEVPLFLDMIRAEGATPTPMALAEVYLSLQTGVVDGQENPLSTIFAQKFFEVQKYLNLTAHIITPQIPLVNAKFFRALPDADRAILMAAFAEGARVNDEAARKAETTLRDELAKRGMTVIEPDRAAFQAAMQPVYAKYEDIWGKGVYQQLLSLK